MASSSPWSDIEDNFFECSVCLGNFTEPKLLPCLHRYCEGCLAGILKKHNKVFGCPLCSNESAIPSNGVEGYKTDFHMKSMLQFIQLRKSAGGSEVRECAGCQKEDTVTGYCFKCKGFLCRQCYDFHRTSRMVEEHKNHSLSLRDMEAKHLTLEKLASLKEAPRCHVHPEYMAQLCCCSCGNVPVCVACTYDDHKDHDLHGVKYVAKIEREKLAAKVEEMKQGKENVYSLSKRVESVRAKLESNAKAEHRRLKEQHAELTEMIDNRLNASKEMYEQGIMMLNQREEEEIDALNEELELKIQNLREEYANKIELKKKDIRVEQAGMGENHRDESEKLGQKRLTVEESFQKMNKMITAEQKHHEQQIEETLEYSKQRMNRFVNFDTTVSSILASNNDWTDAMCLPDITAASVTLIEDVKKQVPEFESLAEVTQQDLSVALVDVVTVEERGDTSYGVPLPWSTAGVTGCAGGFSIITNDTSKDCPQIAVTDIGGNVMLEFDQRNVVSEVEGVADCDSFSPFEIAAVIPPSKVAIYDIRKGSHIKKDISDITSFWPAQQPMVCIAADCVNRIAYVAGNESKELFVIDDCLNYKYTLILPEPIEQAFHMAFCDSKLLVCDSQKAYAVTLDGQTGNLLCEFPNPGIDGEPWSPRRAVADKFRFVYILWDIQRQDDEWQTQLVQYTMDGRQMTAREVDALAEFVTTLNVDGEEQLMVASWHNFVLYRLIPDGLGYGTPRKVSSSGLGDA